MIVVIAGIIASATVAISLGFWNESQWRREKMDGVSVKVVGEGGLTDRQILSVAHAFRDAWPVEPLGWSHFEVVWVGGDAFSGRHGHVKKEQIELNRNASRLGGVLVHELAHLTLTYQEGHGYPEDVLEDGRRVTTWPEWVDQAIAEAWGVIGEAGIE